MKASEIKVGETYMVKVSGHRVPVTIREARENYSGRRYWVGVNTKTGRDVRINSAQRCRFNVKDATRYLELRSRILDPSWTPADMDEYLELQKRIMGL